MELIQKICYRAKGNDEDDPKKPMRFIASTPKEDSYGDIIIQNWDLSDFETNPVIPWGHDYFSPPIGKAVKVAVEPAEGFSQPVLQVWIQFDMDDPKAADIAGKYRRGFLNAVSVGFSPLDWQRRYQLDKADPLYSERGTIFRKSKLKEISAVTIPANPEALGQRSAASFDAATIAKQIVSNPTFLDELRAHLALNGIETDEKPVDVEKGFWDSPSEQQTPDFWEK
jgi:HK97 family phage prohead protease